MMGEKKNGFQEKETKQSEYSFSTGELDVSVIQQDQDVVIDIKEGKQFSGKKMLSFVLIL